MDGTSLDSFESGCSSNPSMSQVESSLQSSLPIESSSAQEIQSPIGSATSARDMQERKRIMADLQAARQAAARAEKAQRELEKAQREREKAQRQREKAQMEREQKAQREREEMRAELKDTKAAMRRLTQNNTTIPMTFLCRVM